MNKQELIDLIDKVLNDIHDEKRSDALTKTLNKIDKDYFIIKMVENEVMIVLTKSMYNLILSTPVINQISEEMKLEEIEYYDNFLNNIRKIKFQTEKFTKHAEYINKEGGVDSDFEEIFFPDKIKDYNGLVEFLDVVTPFFENAKKIGEVLAKDNSFEEYKLAIQKLNYKVVESLKKIDKFINNKENQFLDKSDVYESVASYVDEINQRINAMLLGVELGKEKEEVRIIESVKSKEQIERENAVKKANDMFNQLELDWIRDLKNQFSFSVKERVDAFMKKYEAFKERFKFPLAPNTSIGRANEAIRQINVLMNNISDISSETYSIDMH